MLRHADVAAGREAARAEAEQQHLEAVRLAALVEQSTDAITVATPDGTIIFVNPTGRRLIGLSGSQTVQATTLAEYFTPEDQDTVRHTVLPAVQRDGAWEGTLHLRDFGTGRRRADAVQHVRHPG